MIVFYEIMTILIQIPIEEKGSVMSLSIEGNHERSYFCEILSYVDECCHKSTGTMVIYLEGGHFNHRFGVDEFSVNTLRDAIFLGKALIRKYPKKVRLVYGILIDDLGISCSEDLCTVNSAPINERKEQELPHELEKVIAETELIKRDKLMLFSERTSKNRAISTIKKKINHDSIIVTQHGLDNEVNIKTSSLGIFMLARRKGHVFTAKCPAIISQHYKDVMLKLTQRFFKANSFVIIDWSDASDKTKVLQGVSSYSIFKDEPLCETTIINVFFGDDEGAFVDVCYSIQ